MTRFSTDVGEGAELQCGCAGRKRKGNPRWKKRKGTYHMKKSSKEKKECMIVVFNPEYR